MNPHFLQNQLCQGLGVSRSCYYLREKRQAIRAAKDKELYEATEAVVLEFAGYGYRRVVMAKHFYYNRISLVALQGLDI